MIPVQTFSLASLMQHGLRLAQHSASDPVELRAQVESVAKHISGLGPGRVLLACEKLKNFVPALLGSWQAGRVVELPPNGKVGTLTSLASDASIACIATDRELSDLQQPQLDVAVLLAARPNAKLAAFGSRQELRTFAPDEVVLEVHTSGSTAAPKRVRKTAQQLFGEVEALAAHFAPHLEGPLLATVSAFQLYGLLFGVLLPQKLGLSLVDDDPIFPGDVARLLSEQKVRTLVTTPAHLRALRKTPLADGLRILSSGSVLDGALHTELVMASAVHIHDILGSSETGGIATREEPLSDWRALPNVRVEVDDDQTLVVFSAWSCVSRTEERALLREDGTFQLLGRRDDVVKVAGKRVDLAAIDQVVRTIEGVTDVALASYTDVARGSRIVMLVTPASLDTAMIRAALAQTFDPVVVPRPIVAVPAIPRSDRGKVQKDTILALSGLKARIPKRHFEFLAQPELGRFAVDVRAHCIFFEGHFRDFPILPGVVPLAEMAMPQIRKLYPDLGRLLRLSRARFRRPIFPDRQVELRLTRKDNVVQYELHSESELAASANLHFEARSEFETR
jgi:acyl-coenzyme A synthetase/AMP-(fatty) acid ligase/3-hydroxymyristoyl/3-hydroxydecanoyl-(acyl carrier protein) dehydratase